MLALKGKAYQMPKQFFFKSDDAKVAAHLYMPQEVNKPKIPGIVMCHGFAGVKEMLLPNFAKRFAENGYAVLTFDYRGFGQSEGEPGRLKPSLQIEDIINALAYIRSCSQVDSERIALWGTSFGGANAIITATKDKNIKSIAVQLTFGDGQRVVTNGMSEKEAFNLYSLIEKMEERKTKTGKEMFVPILKVVSDPQSKAFYDSHVGQFPELKIKIPMLTVAETIKHKPELVIGDVKAPILITAAGQDGVNPLEESKILFQKANNPKEFFVIENATHYEIYYGEYFEKAIAKQLEWFNGTLG